MIMERIETSRLIERILAARVIHEVQTSVPIRISMTKFSKKQTVLYEHMYIALDTGPAKCIVDLEPEDEIQLTVEANIVHYKYKMERLKSSVI